MKSWHAMVLAVFLAGCGSKSMLVQATGSANAPPDMVHFTAIVMTKAKTAADAVKTSNQGVRAILDQLKSDGLGSSAYSVGGFQTRPDCDYNRQLQKTVCNGFDARNSISITLDHVSKLGSVLGQLSSLASLVEPPVFGVKDRKKLESEARLAAIKTAKQQAQEYARASGWKLGKVLDIESSSAVGSQFSPLRYTRGLPDRGNSSNRSSVMATAMAEQELPVPVKPATIDVTESIFVKFELRGRWDVFADERLW